MSDPILVSVIVPTHNRLAMLKRTLAGLEHQTYPSDCYEVIVVDDGSEDETSVYLERLAQQGKLRYLRQSNQGPAAARNAGARAARGGILAFTDDDCLPDEDWLASLVEVYSRSPDVVAGVGTQIREISKGHGLYEFSVFQSDHVANNTETPTVLDTASASYRKDVFFELGGFDEVFPFASGEDVDLGLRMTKAGYALRSTSSSTVLHFGRASLMALMRQSLVRGKGLAILMSRHPEYFAPRYHSKRRRNLRSLLDQTRERCELYLLPRRPRAWALVASLHRFLLVMVGTVEFARTRFRQQVARCVALDLPLVQLFLYSLLAWADHLMLSLGQVIGTFDYTYRQTRQHDRT